jgi:putative ubiquitin-RnfH superfamily antitoxin RatB of RatAB toxin-antitoxin module
MSERSERINVTVPATADPQGLRNARRINVTVPATADPQGLRNARR